MKLTHFASLSAITMLAACTAAQEDEAGDATSTVEAEATQAADTDEGKGVETDANPTDAPKQAANELTCSYPVKADDTAETIKARFGDDAKIETLVGPEGIEIPGVVLWPNDAARRVDVSFADEKRTELAGIDVGEGSAWTLASMKVGDTLAKAQKVNGKPIKFFGFEWDYGGYVTDLNGGKLEKLGGCTASFRLTYKYPDYDPPMKFVGDVEVSSDAKELNAEKVTIYVMGVGFTGKE